LTLGQIAIQRDRLSDIGDAQDAALLGGLDDIGAHPLAVNPADLGEAVTTGCSDDAPISTAFCTM